MMARVLAIALVATSCVRESYGETPAKTFSQVARARTLPVGAPRYSDVSLSSRIPRPWNEHDPHDTFVALQAFHATHLDWVNTLDSAFVHQLHGLGYGYVGLNVGACDQPDPADKTSFRIGRAQRADGAPLTFPGLEHKPVARVIGCPNNPDWREVVWKPYVRQNLDAGADGIHQAGAKFSAVSAALGGCYCKYCVQGFRDFLARRAQPAQFKEWGISAPETFDIRAHVMSVSGGEFPGKGKPYAGVSIGLHEMFVKFQMDSAEQFYQDMRTWMNDYAGRRVPFSCNNGSWQSWDSYLLPFDFGYSELMTKTAYPEHLRARFHATWTLGKAQAVSAPKPAKPIDLETFKALTRNVIATTYALGGHTCVPWDVYMPGAMPRYFGKPEDYADLYGFVRANAQYLDRYEDAAAIGPGLEDERWGEEPPITIEGGSGGAYAFVRARPNEPDAPVVIHLVDWGPKRSDKYGEQWMRGPVAPLSVALRTRSFGNGRQLAAKLLMPVVYDAVAHDRAESKADRMREPNAPRGAAQSHAYASLSEVVPVQTVASGEIMRFSIPKLTPWGIVVMAGR